MDKYHLIKEILILLALSIPISFIFQKLKLPVLIGFIITGIIIGPGGLGLISDISSVDLLAEIGVVLLLFTIGLEFSSLNLKQLSKIFLWGGLFQVVITIIVTAVILFLFTKNTYLSIFSGFLISLSSTAIVMKILSDKGELDSPQGNISIGILLFQDLCVIPMMVIIPFIKDIGSFNSLVFIKAIGFTILSIVIVYFVVKLVFARVVDYIAKLNNRELFTISVVVICVGTAYLSARLGLSLSIGAFLAGFILSRSEYSHQIVSDILPFRYCFNSIFFISIGMLIAISVLVSNAFLILGGALAIIILKLVIIIPIIMLFKYPLRIAIIVGFYLAQIGEFSFVLGKYGYELNLITSQNYQFFVTVSVISMILTPLLIKIAPKIGIFFQRRFKASLSDKEDDLQMRRVEDLENHVVIVGYGLNGRNLARVLKETGIKYVVVEMNAGTVKEAKKENEPIIFGDFTNEDILVRAGIDGAKVAVIAISDPVATRHGLWLIKRINPKIYAIVRTRYNSEIVELQKLGANQVIPEEFETSIEIFSRVLDQFHIPKNVIIQEVNLIRRENYKMLRGISLESKMIQDIRDIINLTLTETVLIRKNSKAVGKTILETKIRESTGSTIIAVVREGKAYTNPKSDFIIQADDILVILGSHAELDKAIKYINEMELL